MKQAVPHKKIIPAPALESNSCACSECPYMKMNTLEKLYNALYYELPEINIASEVHEPALRALNNMLTVI
jgi:quinolinate synthase